MAFYANSPYTSWWRIFIFYTLLAYCVYLTTEICDVIFDIGLFVFFVWFDSLRPINNRSALKGWVFQGWTSTKLGLMCLAQGHNAVTPVRLEPTAPRSQVKHSTTEPLRSHLTLESNVNVKHI